MRRSLVVTGVVAALVFAGCGSSPPLLPGASSSNAGASREMAAADMSMMVANVRYELADGVKTDIDKAKAYKLPDASKSDAERIAKAFGVTGSVHADEGGWTVGAAMKDETQSSIPSKSVYMSKNGSWSMNGDMAVSSGSVGCASPEAEARAKEMAAADEPMPIEPCDAPVTTTTVPPNMPSEAEARSIATKALKAAGVDTDGMKATVERFDLVTSIRFQPVFDGKPVDGFEYAVSVNPDRSIGYANGYAGDMDSVGTYDLATLERAVERLNAQSSAAYGGNARDLAATSDMGAPEPMIDADPGAASDDVAVAPEEPVADVDPQSTEPTVIKLTGVSVGLTMTFDESLWLTPAYVFTTDDQGTVVTQAAADKHLPKPEEPKANDGGDNVGSIEPDPAVVDPAPSTGSGSGTGGGTSGSSGGSAGSGGGATEPAPAPAPVPSSGNCAPLGNGIEGQVCADSTSIKAGGTVTFKITAVDNDRAFVDGPCFDGVTPEYGDEDGGEARCMACSTSVAEGPGKIERTRKHTYAKAGTYTAKFTVKSGPECAEPHPGDSTSTVSLTIKVA